MPFPIPRNEARRLIELRGHEIMDTTPEPAFERIARVAARFFAMPMSAVSFVDEYRVWFKASHGLSQTEAARDASLCAHAILQERVLVIRDTREDRRFVGGPEALRFYAGAPLRTAEGQALGVLCVMDTAPREFTREDEETLTDLAAVVMDELNLRRLTGRLRTEIDHGRQTRRLLTRQQQLLRRLGGSMEDHIRLRTSELTRANQSLRAEITCYERTDAALQRAKEEAEKANAAKSEFLSRMSHELRTPLNAILGFGQILRGPLPAEEQRECASHVVTAGRHLLSLINEVLDIARIEAGWVELSVEPVQVSEVIDEALDLIRPLAAARGINIEVSVEIGTGRAVLADRQRFKQVLLNLLSNAVKYSPTGGSILVACRAERSRTMRLSVTDQGPGVAPEQAGRLFVAFDRLGAERSEIPGTGLGLSLSKRFIEAMGGKIGFKTAPGRGSAFWVRLPLSRSGVSVVRETSAPDAYRADRAVDAACTVLYIEDNPSDLRLIEHLLASCPGVRLLCARHGEEGLEIAQRERPDLILLDLHLSDVPGWEVLARLRREKATRHIPVVAVSVDAATDTIERVMQAGAQAFLTKPLNLSSLYRLLPATMHPPVSITDSELAYKKRFSFLPAT